MRAVLTLDLGENRQISFELVVDLAVVINVLPALKSLELNLGDVSEAQTGCDS